MVFLSILAAAGGTTEGENRVIKVGKNTLLYGSLCVHTVHTTMKTAKGQLNFALQRGGCFA